MKKLLIIAILLISISLFSTTYYVKKTGADGAGVDGSDSTPWLTLNYALSRVSDLDTVYISAGTYVENGTGAYGWYLNADKDVDWIGVGTVIVKGDAGATSGVVYLRGNSKTSTFTNITFSGVLDGGGFPTTTLYIHSDAHDKTFTNCTITTGATSRELLALGNGVTFSDGTIGGTATNTLQIGGGTPTIDNCTITSTPSAAIIYFYNLAKGTATITDNTITSTTAGTIYNLAIGGDYVLSGNTDTGLTTTTNIMTVGASTGSISMDDETYNCPAIDPAGILFDIDSGTWTTNVNNSTFIFTGASMDQDIFYFLDQATTIFDNNEFKTDVSGTITHISLSSVGSSTGVPQITNNIFQTKSVADYTLIIGSDGSSVHAADFDGAIVTGNALYGADYYDSTADSENHGLFMAHIINANVSNNYCNGSGMGIALKEDGRGYTSGGLFNNIIINCAYTGILLKGVQDVPVYNNTIIYTNQTLSSSGINIRKNDASGDADGSLIKNNVIYSTAPTANFSSITLGEEEFDEGDYAIDYNDTFSTQGTGFRSAADGTTYTDIASWRTKLTDAANSINSDPKFNDNYSIKSNSPCKGTGATLAATYDDQLANDYSFPDPDLVQQTAPWNMGAIEPTKATGGIGSGIGFKSGFKFGIRGY